MARSNRAETGETAPNRVVYYAPDGSEYPVNEDTLTAVERTNLVAQGYGTEKPSKEDAQANAVEIPDGGPLSGAADPT